MPRLEQTRSDKTRERLLRAAERLFASRRIENVTARSIVVSAGQKNESALHYHFKNRAGLVSAIHTRRNAQTQEKRAIMVQELLARTPSPSLREICTLMVEPPFRLARVDAGYRQYIRAFSEGAATSRQLALEPPVQGAEWGAIQMQRLLRASLAHLNDVAFAQRFEDTVRFARLSMSVHARRSDAFRGQQSEVFLNMLIDAMAGMLAAPVSEQTRKALTAASRRT